MTRPSIEEILAKHTPPSAVPYCLELWDAHPFKFKLRNTRQSKVGDFICRQGAAPEITVNRDLHPYLFLITYVHEVAHLVVHRRHQRNADPHGAEWKQAFIELMNPLMTSDIFPSNLKRQLAIHMRDPKASSFSDAELTAVLRTFDPKWSGATLLSEIPEGSIFGLRGRWFRKGSLRRTRFLCLEVKTKRKFLVPADLPVENAQLSLL